MKPLRNFINNIKPNFIADGKYSKWFPLFDAIELIILPSEFFFSPTFTDTVFLAS